MLSVAISRDVLARTLGAATSGTAISVVPALLALAVHAELTVTAIPVRIARRVLRTAAGGDEQRSDDEPEGAPRPEERSHGVRYARSAQAAQ